MKRVAMIGRCPSSKIAQLAYLEADRGERLLTLLNRITFRSKAGTGISPKSCYIATLLINFFLISALTKRDY